MKAVFRALAICGICGIAAIGLARTPGTPKVVKTNPERNATDVDPGLTTVTVSFDRRMGPGFSWTGVPPLMPVMPEGTQSIWRDPRTCELPVKLEPGKMYRIGLNSTNYRNFASNAGSPLPPDYLTFCTKGASAEVVAQMHPPKVLSFNPPHGSTNVKAGMTTITVTFDQAMDAGSTIVEAGPSFPDKMGRPSWSEDQKKLMIPVLLSPNETYEFSLNSDFDSNVASKFGIPLEQTVYHIQTGSEGGGAAAAAPAHAFAPVHASAGTPTRRR